MTQHPHDDSHLGRTIVGLAAIAAAAAGTYFLYGSENAEKNRRALKGWMVKMKGEVMERIEELKDVSEEAYYRAIDEVKEKYAHYAHIGKEDLEAMADDMKSRWKDIEKEIEPHKTKAKRSAK